MERRLTEIHMGDLVCLKQSLDFIFGSSAPLWGHTQSTTDAAGDTIQLQQLKDLDLGLFASSQKAFFCWLRFGIVSCEDQI